VLIVLGWIAGSRRPAMTCESSECVSALAIRDSRDAVVERFAEEFSILLENVVWDAENPTIKGGPYPQRDIRIEMDERSLAIYRTWSTGWRAVDDPSPIPVPTLKMQIANAEGFRSGLG